MLKSDTSIKIDARKSVDFFIVNDAYRMRLIAKVSELCGRGWAIGNL